MEIKTTILPGQNGTKRLVKQYGEQLVCVRYRYDKQRCKRYKTVELIVDEQDWIPNTLTRSDKIVPIRVGFEETDLRRQVKAAGGFWDRDNKRWLLPYHKVQAMGLVQRIVEPDLDL